MNSDEAWARAHELGVSRWLRPCALAWVRSWRVEIVGRQRLDSSAPVIFALWHGQMASLLGGVSVVGSGRVAMLAAPWAQARFVGQVVAPLGISFVEAPTGSASLVRAARKLQQGWSMAVAVDGPAGPVGHARSGASMLSRMTGAPVVPVTATARPVWVPEGFWDRAAVPLPCARVEIHVGVPIAAPAGRAQVKAHVAEVQRQLDRAPCVPGAHT